MYLLPQLPNHAAVPRARHVAVRSVQECRDERGEFLEKRTYTATGGARVLDSDYRLWVAEIEAIASQHGYPDPALCQGAACDIAMAGFLHERLRISFNEASKPGVWQYLTCAVLPDVVRWRFWDVAGATSPRNFLGLTRNYFGKLWWRAALLQDRARPSDPLHLLRELIEDAIVNIMERPTLAGARDVALRVGKAWVQQIEVSPLGDRQGLMRGAAKRMLRVMSNVAIEALEEEQLDSLIAEIFAETRSAIESAR